MTSCWTRSASTGGQSPRAFSRLPIRGPGRHRTAGGDEAGFVGRHDGLDAVAEAEFGQYPPDVDFDGAFGQVQLGGDLAVGSPGGELGEDRRS